MNTPHFFLIAGEASGDLLGAELIEKLKSQYPDAQFSALGGMQMEKQGAQLLFPLAQYGVTGFTAVFRQLKMLRHAFTLAKNFVIQRKPELIILIDYPGFNLRFAKKIKAFSRIPILYYVSPQIWAWKSKRIFTIKKYVDFMAVIFPFERTLYEAEHIPVAYVGHPLLHRVHVKKNKETILSELQLHLPHGAPLVGLLPGSRLNELRRLLTVLAQTAELLIEMIPDIHFILPVAPTLSLKEIHTIISPQKLAQFRIMLSLSDRYDVMAACDCVVSASGTACLELALLTRPMIIIYRTDCLSYLLARLFVRIPYLGICNIVAEKSIVPELIQFDLRPAQLAEMTKRLLQDHSWQQNMQIELQKMKNLLKSDQNQACITTIVNTLLPLKE